MFLVVPILLLVIVAGGFYVTQPLNSLTIDVNPSIEIVTNRLDRIVRINPLNTDAENLLMDFNPKDKRLEKTISELVDLMILTGYIHREKDNFLMITVDDSVNSKLIAKVNSAIAINLKNKQIEATVLNQSVPKSNKADDLTGVQLATLRILEMNKSLDPNIFTSMTVNDLLQYSNANNIPVERLFVLVDNELVDADDDSDD